MVLPETSTRKATQLYVVAFIDDATRFVTELGVYEEQTADRVLACYRQAVERHGVPDRIFTDNGKQFIGKQISQASVKLGVKLLRARPYAAASKGKVEAFNKLLDKFVLEMKRNIPVRCRRSSIVLISGWRSTTMIRSIPAPERHHAKPIRATASFSAL